MLKCKKMQVIEHQDWDDFVTETYGRPYRFQQQDDVRSRGTYCLTVPSTFAKEAEEDMYDSIPEVVDGEKRGVKFASWLARDPKQKGPDMEEQWEVDLFWQRNFYPNVETLANDLHAKGLMAAGEYLINIDW